MPTPKRRKSYKQEQAVTTFVINEQVYERIRFDADAASDRVKYRGDWLCGHCDVSDYSFHLLGCEAERCPRCRKQVISCPCEFEQRPGKPRATLPTPSSAAGRLGMTTEKVVRRRHPRIILLHWSKRAYHIEGDRYGCFGRGEGGFEEDEATEISTPLYPAIKLVGPHRWEQAELFPPKRGSAPRKFDFIEVGGPVSDDIVPIIFGSDHRGVYVRLDVAEHLKPHMAPSQRLTPVRCDGDTIPYLALTETDPEVWLPEDWVGMPHSERLAREFSDGATLVSPIFPDAFDLQRGVHFVGNYRQIFLDIVVWNSLRKAIPSVAHWLAASRIVVEEKPS